MTQAITSRRSPPGIEDAAREGSLVLLVDDHPINCMVLLHQVNTLGYAAETAENGAIALQKWQSGRFSLVITDCNMPVMDGYDLARRIREAEAHGGLRRTPIIASSANALGSESQQCSASSR